MNDFVKGILSGIFILSLLAFVVGFGVCFYVAKEIGIFDNEDRKAYYQEEYNKDLKRFNETKQNATSDSPDPEKVMLYAKYLNSQSHRKYLKLDISEEEAKAQADSYFQKARQLGSPSMRLADAKKVLSSRLTYSKKQSPKPLTANDITIIENELNNVIDIVKNTCHAYSIDGGSHNYDFYKSQINTQFFDHIHPDIAKYPNIQYQIIN